MFSPVSLVLLYNMTLFDAFRFMNISVSINSSADVASFSPPWLRSGSFFRFFPSSNSFRVEVMLTYPRSRADCNIGTISILCPRSIDRLHPLCLSNFAAIQVSRSMAEATLFVKRKLQRYRLSSFMEPLTVCFLW